MRNSPTAVNFSLLASQKFYFWVSKNYKNMFKTAIMTDAWNSQTG